MGALWDETAFSGLFIDRRPLLTGQPPLLYPIPVSVSGSRITLTVPAALAEQVRAAVVLPGATWNCLTLWSNAGNRNWWYPHYRRDRETALAPMICLAFWIAV